MKSFAAAARTKLFPKNVDGTTQISLLGFLFLLLLIPVVFVLGTWLSPIMSALMSIHLQILKIIFIFCTDVNEIGTAIASGGSNEFQATGIYKPIKETLTFMWGNKIAVIWSLSFLFLLSTYSKKHGTPCFVKKLGSISSVSTQILCVNLLYCFADPSIVTAILVVIVVLKYALIDILEDIAQRRSGRK